MQLIGLSIVFGFPGLLLGLALGVVIRHWPPRASDRSTRISYGIVI
jgi:hypothetical protein